METTKLKKFARFARRGLIEQVSAKLEMVLAENSAARRERAEAVKRLEEAIKRHCEKQVIERVAYIWFNRFCALRFMDVNRYTRIGVVSPAEGQFQPEILAEAKMGHIDEEMVRDKVQQKIFDLLDGKTPGRDPQGEAYRLLVVAACNSWNKVMPFLFQHINDYTELLMPDDLLSGNSILAYTREAMTPDACKDVEVIGWLYQFYISEKKDEVFDGLKRNRKIEPENIPAATQLFTPHWIVRYLVENSLGRLWMLNRPGSKLVEQMDYYIKPEQPETDFLKISDPEEIKVCDPACGSGHMLTYAFDLLHVIYEEEGHDPAAIPKKILANNLYGIEIDERAGELAAFALIMKARSKQRRFFNKGVKPNICVLENVQLNEGKLQDYMDLVGRDLFTVPLLTTLCQFEEADNFGSLIRPAVTDLDGIRKILESKNVSEHLFLRKTHLKVLQALRQADYLSPKYHVVIANPPYMGGRGMNGRLEVWAKDKYPNSKSDLFAMFMERNLDLARKQGVVAMITMQSWMFLSSYRVLRTRILNHYTLLSMAHLGARAFDSIGGEVVSTTAFVLGKEYRPEYNGGFLRLVNGNTEAEKKMAINEAVMNPDCGWLYRATAADFKKIPGIPIVYWLGSKFVTLFEKKTIGEVYEVGSGLSTSDNERFVRFIWEVSRKNVNTKARNCTDSLNAHERWYLFQKGGEFRKWYGNLSHLVNWKNNGEEIKKWVTSNPRDPDTTHWSRRIFNTELYFRRGITWSTISSGKISFRFSEEGSMISNAAGGIFGISDKTHVVNFMCGINTKLWTTIVGVVNPTINYSAGIIQRTPLPDNAQLKFGNRLVHISKSDWNSYETSWDFTTLPLLYLDYGEPTLKATYKKLRTHWREMTQEMQRLEEENNSIFIEIYGLQGELTPEVPLNEITLTCNPYYRYGGDKSEDELEALLLADTVRELVSYAVGCMFGRYALDKPGLILANQGEGIDDFRRKIFNLDDSGPKQKSAIENLKFKIAFPPDEDNVIPLLDGDWFTDDITERFKRFLRVAFGEEYFEENLQLVEKALGKNGKARDIRDYFLKDFYSDHVKRYKKRPIYWLFSSPKASFNALIYMHRYRPDTVSVVLNDYLREFRANLTFHKNHLEAVSDSDSASQSEKITRMIAEIEEYECEVLYPLATEQVEIDLDDGVKVNYPKLGAALKKIVGLSTEGGQISEAL